MGWIFGTWGLLFPLLTVPALTLAGRLPIEADYWLPYLYLLAYTLPLFSAAGVLLGGWLKGLSSSGSDERPIPQLYAQGSRAEKDQTSRLEGARSRLAAIFPKSP